MEDNNFFALFLWKNLVVSKKSSTFALAFEGRRTLPNGVMVALQILVLSVWVRVLVWQQLKEEVFRTSFFVAKFAHLKKKQYLCPRMKPCVLMFHNILSMSPHNS